MDTANCAVQSHEQGNRNLLQPVYHPKKPYPATIVSELFAFLTPGQVKEAALVFFGFGIIFFFQRQHSCNSNKSIYTNNTEKKTRQQKTLTAEVSIDKPSSLNYTSDLQVASAVKDISLPLEQ